MHAEYVGKAELTFKIRVNDHRSDASDKNAIPACRHFGQKRHNSKAHSEPSRTSNMGLLVEIVTG